VQLKEVRENDAFCNTKPIICGMGVFFEQRETIVKMSGCRCLKRKRQKEHDNARNWM